MMTISLLPIRLPLIGMTVSSGLKSLAGELERFQNMNDLVHAIHQLQTVRFDLPFVTD